MALEVDVRPGTLVDDDEGDGGKLREPIRLGDGNRRAAAPGVRILGILVILAAPVPPDPERLGSERGEHVRDALVEAADQRADHHHDRHADRDAEDRERRAHLVRAQ